MTDPANDTGAYGPTQSRNAAAGMKAGGLRRYLLFGGIGLVLVAVVAAVTLLLVGGNQTQPARADHQPKVAAAGGAESADSLTASGQDDQVLDQIIANLEALNYQPTPEELDGKTPPPMSAEDSTAAVSWLEKEKAAIAARQHELDEREQRLNTREQAIADDMLKLQKAESERIATLARLYDNMDPLSVAKTMVNLDDETTVALLAQMKTRNASEVLQLLPPRRAANLSKQMITIVENQ